MAEILVWDSSRAIFFGKDLEFSTVTARGNYMTWKAILK
jgi:hypothetical protein